MEHDNEKQGDLVPKFQAAHKDAFLMERDNDKQGDLLLKRWPAFFLTVHPTLNPSCGIIRCGDVADTSDIDIGDELEDQPVSAVKRIRIKKQPCFVLSDWLSVLRQWWSLFVYTFNWCSIFFL